MVVHLAQAAQGFQAVHLRHVVVQQDQLGLQLAEQIQGLLAMSGFADDLQVCFEFEQLAHAAAHHRVVVDEQDAVTDRRVHAALPSS
ncbi:hypothetical protein D3C84_234120 [compost metagenome]